MKKLKLTDWNTKEKKRIAKLFNGLADDWKKESLDDIKTALKDELFIAQKSSCAYCKRAVFPEIGRVEIDHIIPKSIAPQFTFSKMNLVLTCKRCNHRKREHNPSLKSSAALLKLKIYPKKNSDYCWVHPYIHNYDEHVKIESDCIFIPKNGSADGLAVITVCKLHQIKQIISRMRSSVIRRAREPMHALIELAGAYPDTDAKTLAEETAKIHQTVSVDSAIKFIEMIRSANPASILNDPI
jgi:hypothetical protein